MSVLEGMVVRTAGGAQGRVMAVQFTTYSERDGDCVDDVYGFAALIMTTDRKLLTVRLDDAEVLQQREPRPVPLPIAPAGVTHNLTTAAGTGEYAAIEEARARLEGVQDVRDLATLLADCEARARNSERAHEQLQRAHAELTSDIVVADKRNRDLEARLTETNMLKRDAQLLAMDRGASYQAAVAERDEAREQLVELMKYVDDAKRVGAGDIVTGEPLADYVRRLRADLVDARAKLRDEQAARADLRLEINRMKAERSAFAETAKESDRG